MEHAKGLSTLIMMREHRTLLLCILCRLQSVAALPTHQFRNREKGLHDARDSVWRAPGRRMREGMRLLVSLFLLSATTMWAQGLPSRSLQKGAWDFGVQTTGGIGLYGNSS